MNYFPISVICVVAMSVSVMGRPLFRDFKMPTNVGMPEPLAYSHVSKTVEPSKAPESLDDDKFWEARCEAYLAKRSATASVPSTTTEPYQSDRDTATKKSTDAEIFRVAAIVQPRVGDFAEALPLSASGIQSEASDYGQFVPPSVSKLESKDSDYAESSAAATSESRSDVSNESDESDYDYDTYMAAQFGDEFMTRFSRGYNGEFRPEY